MLVRLLLLPYRLYAVLALMVVVLLIFCPLILLLPTLSLRRATARFGVRAALAAIGVPMRVHGLENVPQGVCIAVSNHASYLDGLVLNAALPAHFAFVVKGEAARWPYAGSVLRRLGAHFVNRYSAREGAAQTRALLRQLKNGESLAIFAEGTMRAEPGLMPFKNGAFLLASLARCPVLPVGIQGTRTLFGGDRKLPLWSRVDVFIGSPLPTQRDASALRDAARAAVLPLCGEPDLHAPPLASTDLM